MTDQEEMLAWLKGEGYESPEDAIVATWRRWTNGAAPLRSFKQVEFPICGRLPDDLAYDAGNQPEPARMVVFTSEPGTLDGRRCVRFMGSIPGLGLPPVEVATIRTVQLW